MNFAGRLGLALVKPCALEADGALEEGGRPWWRVPSVRVVAC